MGAGWGIDEVMKGGFDVLGMILYIVQRTGYALAAVVLMPLDEILNEIEYEKIMMLLGAVSI